MVVQIASVRQKRGGSTDDRREISGFLEIGCRGQSLRENFNPGWTT